MKKLLLLLAISAMLMSCARPTENVVVDNTDTRMYKVHYPDINVFSIVKSKEPKNRIWVYTIGDTVLVNRVNSFIMITDHSERAVITEYLK